MIVFGEQLSLRRNSAERSTAVQQNNSVLVLGAVFNKLHRPTYAERGRLLLAYQLQKFFIRQNLIRQILSVTE